jgi:SAM-dependent methyltransferase
MPWQGYKRGLQKLAPPRVLQTNPQLDSFLAQFTADQKICDVGSGGRRIASNVMAIDKFVQDNVDLVCDIHAIELPDNSVDGAICTGVLEHVEDPAKVVQEIFRILKPGGMAYLDVPFIQPYHPDPLDYWRWTLPGFQKFCLKNTGFEEVKAGVHIGASSAMYWLLIDYFKSFSDHPLLQKVLGAIPMFLAFPMVYLDYLLIHKKSSVLLPSGVFFIGRKP